MTADGHPGERYYKSDLIWDRDGGKDLYLKERLMCSGFDAKPKDAGKCLIKNEWGPRKFFSVKVADDFF